MAGGKSVSISRKVGLVGGALILVGGLVYALLPKSDSGTWIQVRKKPAREVVYGLGKVKSQRIFDYKPGSSHTVEKIEVQEGDEVRANQVLLKLSEGVGIRSPFAGTVTRVLVHEGENVYAQGSILRVESVNDLYVEVVLEQQGAVRILKGQKARLAFENLKDISFEAQVETIYPANDQFVLRVRPKNLPSSVLPGMTADVGIEIREIPDALLIPVASYKEGQVTRRRSGKIEKVSLKTGPTEGDELEVIEGDLVEGDEVLQPKSTP